MVIIWSLCCSNLDFYVVIDIPTMGVSKRRGRYPKFIEEFTETSCAEVNQCPIDYVLRPHDGFV